MNSNTRTRRTSGMANNRIRVLGLIAAEALHNHARSLEQAIESLVLPVESIHATRAIHDESEEAVVSHPIARELLCCIQRAGRRSRTEVVWASPETSQPREAFHHDACTRSERPPSHRRASYRQSLPWFGASTKRAPLPWPALLARSLAIAQSTNVAQKSLFVNIGNNQHDGRATHTCSCTLRIYCSYKLASCSFMLI